MFSVKYKVTPKTHAVLREEIERLKDGGKKEEVKENVREVCELLTGIKYENLFDKRNCQMNRN